VVIHGPSIAFSCRGRYNCDIGGSKCCSCAKKAYTFIIRKGFNGKRKG
jgi:hypothetical protein